MNTSTVNIGGNQTVVNAQNWSTLARLKIAEVRAERPDSPPAEQLAIYRAFQVMGGVPDAFNKQNADGTVRFNDFGASAVLNNPFVRAADAVEGVERSVLGQGAVDALHIVSNQAVAAGGRIKSFVLADVPAGARNLANKLRDFFDVAGTAAKWAVVGAVAVAVVVIVVKVKK